MKIMTTYSFVINAQYEDAVITVQTNDIDIAIESLFEHTSEGAKCDLYDGFTGEVYVTTNTEEPYITEQWALTILGWLMANNWGM